MLLHIRGRALQIMLGQATRFCQYSRSCKAAQHQVCRLDCYGKVSSNVFLVSTGVWSLLAALTSFWVSVESADYSNQMDAPCLSQISEYLQLSGSKQILFHNISDLNEVRTSQSASLPSTNQLKSCKVKVVATFKSSRINHRNSPL